MIAHQDIHPIGQDRLLALLFASHGPAALEQIAIRDEAARMAQAKGLAVTQSDLDAEYERSLLRIVDPWSKSGKIEGGGERMEELLASVLSEMNMSPESFRLLVERNTYLRKIAEADLIVDDEQLRAQYERTFGKRVQIRHIQVGTLADVTHIRERVDAGEDFAELARRFSMNPLTGPRGGLLEPFSVQDEEVPEVLRRTAFELSPGGISSGIRLGRWFHVITLERTIPAEQPDFSTVRSQLEQKVRNRLAQSVMERLYSELLSDLRLDIHDPVLKEAYGRYRQARSGPKK